MEEMMVDVRLHTIFLVLIHPAGLYGRNCSSVKLGSLGCRLVGQRNLALIGQIASPLNVCSWMRADTPTHPHTSASRDVCPALSVSLVPASGETRISKLYLPVQRNPAMHNGRTKQASISQAMPRLQIKPLTRRTTERPMGRHTARSLHPGIYTLFSRADTIRSQSLAITGRRY